MGVVAGVKILVILGFKMGEVTGSNLKKPDPKSIEASVLNLRVPLKCGREWGKFEGTPLMGVVSGVKMGELLFTPESYLLPLLPFYLRDFLYMISFYSLTSILEFTSETSERERTCK